MRYTEIEIKAELKNDRRERKTKKACRSINEATMTERRSTKVKL